MCHLYIISYTQNLVEPNMARMSYNPFQKGESMYPKPIFVLKLYVSNMSNHNINFF
jgi:hypothetical protein